MTLRYRLARALLGYEPMRQPEPDRAVFAHRVGEKVLWSVGLDKFEVSIEHKQLAEVFGSSDLLGEYVRRPTRTVKVTGEGEE
jgi:hypothetical protein